VGLCFAMRMQNPIAVSTWSVHHLLGYSFANGPSGVAPFRKEATWGDGIFDILQLPAELAKRGYFRCEICHFHIGSLDRVELEKIARAFAVAGVAVQTLLIDDGDITNPEMCERDMAWMLSWIEAAAVLGAENVRVIAGKATPSSAALALSVSGLRKMVALGSRVGVKVATENWHDLLATPVEVHHVLDCVEGLGFMADTGNWSGSTKYDDLASIFSRADLCHAKAGFAGRLQMDEQDFSNCLAAAQRGKYSGPMTLIFHDEGDEWLGLDAERQFVRQFGVVSSA
jgi:sugar phosphate isomerase/epimerase